MKHVPTHPCAGCIHLRFLIRGAGHRTVCHRFGKPTQYKCLDFKVKTA